jgi:hypothetical protein
LENWVEIPFGKISRGVANGLLVLLIAAGSKTAKPIQQKYRKYKLGTCIKIIWPCWFSVCVVAHTLANLAFKTDPLNLVF